MTAGRYRWWVVGMLWLVCLFNYADRQAITAVFPLLESEMKLDNVKLGIVGGAFMWVYAACLPFAGVIADRVSRKALILGGLTFWSLITLVTSFATEYWHLVLCRALEGAGEAFYFPASMSMISDYHDKRTRSRAMGLHQSSVYAGTILGGSFAGFCGEHWGWWAGFYIFGALGVILAAVLLYALREPPREAAPPATRALSDAFNGAGEVLTNRTVLLLTGAFVGANFVAAIFLTWLPKYLHDHFKMSLTLAGVNATLWWNGAMVLGVLCGGWLADHWAARRPGGRVLVQAIGLFVGAPFIFLTGQTSDALILSLALAGFGFCKGLYDANIWAALYDAVPAHRRATAQGLMNSIGWLGAGTAPVAIGAAAQQYGMSACLSATSVIYVCVGFLLLAARLRFRNRGALG